VKHTSAPEALVKVMTHDCGEARVNACTALVYLAKAPENRDDLASITGIFDSLSQTLRGDKKEVDRVTKQQYMQMNKPSPKQMYLNNQKVKHARQHRLLLNKQSSASSLKGKRRRIDLEGRRGGSSAECESLSSNGSLSSNSNTGSYSGSSHSGSVSYNSEFDDEPISGHDSCSDDESNSSFFSGSGSDDSDGSSSHTCTSYEDDDTFISTDLTRTDTMLSESDGHIELLHTTTANTPGSVNPTPQYHIGDRIPLSHIPPDEIPLIERSLFGSLSMDEGDRTEWVQKHCAAARLNASAILIHFSKHCSVAAIMGTIDELVNTIILVSREFDAPLHTKCIEVLCHLTRYIGNNYALARKKGMVDTLIKCGRSKVPDDRTWAIRAFQNLTALESNRAGLSTNTILTVLSISAMRNGLEEQLAAVGALLNLSGEPGAIVPLTNTKNVLATLVHLAHNGDTCADVRNTACDCISTIGLWLQALAGVGVVPKDTEMELLPTHGICGWERWVNLTNGQHT